MLSEVGPSPASLSWRLSTAGSDTSRGVVWEQHVDDDLDAALAQVQEIEQQLDRHLRTIREEFGDREISYKNIGKECYQIQIPARVLQKRAVPSNFERMSQTKDYVRFWTPDIRRMVKTWEERIERRDIAQRSVLKRLLQHFCAAMDTWRRAVNALAELDCLLGLAEFSLLPGMCRPVFVEEQDTERPVLEARQLRHPILAERLPNFVPNDVNLGGSHPPILVVTGSNMGGKSTLLRQVCLAALMAQVGR